MIAGCSEKRIGGEDIPHRVREDEMIQWTEIVTSIIRDGSPSDNEFPRALQHCHVAAVFHRRLFRTVNGRLGLGPQTMQKGDAIWILAGGNTPFILRHIASSQKSGDPIYSLIAPAYLHGVMDGEATGGEEEGEMEELVEVALGWEWNY